MIPLRIKRTTLAHGELERRAFFDHHQVIFSAGARWEISSDGTTFERVGRDDVCVIPAGCERIARFHDAADNIVVMLSTHGDADMEFGAPGGGHRLVSASSLRPIAALIERETRRDAQPTERYADALATILVASLRDALSEPRPRVRRSAMLSAGELHAIEAYVDAHLAPSTSHVRFAQRPANRRTPTLHAVAWCAPKSFSWRRRRCPLPRWRAVSACAARPISRRRFTLPRRAHDSDRRSTFSTRIHAKLDA